MTDEINETDDLSAALSAAWDAAEGVDETETEVSEPEPSEGQSFDSGQPSDDESEVQPEGELDGLQPSGGEGEKPAASAEKPAVDGPPKGLSPEAREAWKDAPEAIKEHIRAYDQRMEGLAQKYGESYQRMQAMDQALAPYQQLFALNGGAQQTIGPLLQTASLLQMGSGLQKAQVAANLIKQFGVDIKMLDSFLVGEQPKASPNDQLEQLLNQKLQPLQQQLEQYQQRELQEQQQSQEQINRELQQFAQQNEFYEDVKGDMADLLEMSANRGRQMSLEEAYNIACSTHPSISKILHSRQNQQSLDAKRAAASSVRGRPANVDQSAGNMSRVAALEEAWDNFGRM